jgi:RHS repeat-associated protein
MKKRLYRMLLGSVVGLGVLSPVQAAGQSDCTPRTSPCPSSDSAAAETATAATADLTRLAPVVSLSPHNLTFRDATQSASTLGYSTPAYVSRDAARSVTLMYSSGQAAPTGYVQVEVTDNSTDLPAKMSILVRNAQGAAVTNEIFYAGANGTSRMAAQWDASSLATGAYDYSVVVRTYWSDGTYNEAAAVAARVLIVNERNSPYGSGWSVAGIPQIYNAQSGDFVVLEESGTVKYFPFTSCTPDPDATLVCYSVHPAGDFSTLKFYYRDNTYVRSFPDGSRQVFTSDGRLMYQRDRFGNQDSVAWKWTTNSPAVLVPDYIQDPAGKRISFGWGTTGKLQWLTDPSARQTLLYFNANGVDLHSIQAPDNSVPLQVTYDGSHRVTQWLDRGQAWNYNYDAATGTVSAVIAPVVTADGVQKQPTTGYRSMEAAVLPATGKGTQANPADRRAAGDVFASITDPRGNVRSQVTDKLGLLVRDINPFGWATVLERNDSGQVVHATMPSGHSVRYTWSGVELSKVYDDAVGDSTVYDYEHTFHQATRARHFAGSVVTYDASNYYSSTTLTLDSTKVAGQPKTAYQFGSDGRIQSQIDAEGHGTFYAFNPDTAARGAGSLASLSIGSVSTTDRRTMKYVYDAYGRDSLTISANNDTTRTTYNLLNQTISVMDPLHLVTSYAYDNTGLSTVTDPKSQVYAYYHNALGWVTSEVDPRSKSISYAYDAAGNVSSLTNRRGQTVGFTYDAMNRPLTRTADGAQTTWTYDAGERWMTAANGEAIDMVRYDVAGRISSANTTRVGVTYAVASGYDGSGNRNLISATGPWTGTKTVGYHYNGLMQLDTLTDFAGGKTPFAYNGDGLETNRVLPNGMSIVRDYPSTHITSEITYLGLLDPKLSVGYQQDSRGLVSARMNSARDTVMSYAYDRLARLTSYSFDHIINSTSTTCSGGALRSPDGGVCAPTGGIKDNVYLDTLKWDAVGNPTNHGAAVTTGNRLTQYNGYTLDYDDDGNLTHKYKTGYDEQLTWTSLGQLAQVVVNGTTVTYGYDAFGRLARRTSGTSAVQYIWDGFDLLFERDQAGALTEYTNYPAIDSPHSLKRGSSIWYYAQDNVGNVTGLIDASKALVNQYQYDPFGGQIFAQAGVTNSLQFQGHQYDATTGLYSFRARWYDSQTGRFVSEDPIRLSGGINMYAFAGENPVNRTDPMGLCVHTGLITLDQLDALLDLKDAVCDTGLDPVTVSVWQLPWDRTSGTARNPSSRGPRLGVPTLANGPTAGEWARALMRKVSVAGDFQYSGQAGPLPFGIFVDISSDGEGGTNLTVAAGPGIGWGFFSGPMGGVGSTDGLGLYGGCQAGKVIAGAISGGYSIQSQTGAISGGVGLGFGSGCGGGVGYSFKHLTAPVG